MHPWLLIVWLEVVNIVHCFPCDVFRCSNQIFGGGGDGEREKGRVRWREREIDRQIDR